MRDGLSGWWEAPVRAAAAPSPSTQPAKRCQGCAHTRSPPPIAASSPQQQSARRRRMAGRMAQEARGRAKAARGTGSGEGCEFRMPVRQSPRALCKSPTAPGAAVAGGWRRAVTYVLWRWLVPAARQLGVAVTLPDRITLTSFVKQPSYPTHACIRGAGARLDWAQGEQLTEWPARAGVPPPPPPLPRPPPALARSAANTAAACPAALLPCPFSAISGGCG